MNNRQILLLFEVVQFVFIWRVELTEFNLKLIPELTRGSYGKCMMPFTIQYCIMFLFVVTIHVLKLLTRKTFPHLFACSFIYTATPVS